MRTCKECFEKHFQTHNLRKKMVIGHVQEGRIEVHVSFQIVSSRWLFNEWINFIETKWPTFVNKKIRKKIKRKVGRRGC